MADVVQFERQHRDSLLHPTPKHEPVRAFTREEVFYEISVDETKQMVDAVIAIIERIDDELNGLFGRVSVWLVKRGVDERYPNSTSTESPSYRWCSGRSETSVGTELGTAINVCEWLRP